MPKGNVGRFTGVTQCVQRGDRVSKKVGAFFNIPVAAGTNNKIFYDTVVFE